ncbi:MAG: indolepyruvate ferredoxin oxidoreductase, alpha subunit [Parcubacteria group bacterium Licking1014_1]|nr:MAG: indolepyruvate ferredoxin oxidoreductase, alpha subunit [Parcubacteria group bacterium Licking1014_1]
MDKNRKILLGDEAIVRGALEAGVDFVSGYPGCPSAEIGDEFLKIAKENGIYAEWSTNEKVALEAAIGASFSGLRSLVNMKSFGLNACSDSLFPLAYTGTKAPMVIIVADDPSCWSSAQSEQDSRGYAYLSHMPMLEPSDPQECYEFTKLGFELSEKFNIPVILRITTRVAHQRMPVELSQKPKTKNQKLGEFIKNPCQFSTMPPRVLEMKKELLEKIEKIRVFAEKSKINKIYRRRTSEISGKVGIVASGVAYLYVKEALGELSIDIPVLKINMFYPLADKTVSNFIKPLKKVLVIEETDGYLEKEIKVIAKDINPKLKIFGKDVLPEVGELNTQKVIIALSKILKADPTGRMLWHSVKIKNSFQISNFKFQIPRRYPKLCENCPYWYVFPTIKRVAPENTVFGGDIGCYMIAGYPPHNMQDYLFSMGSSIGIGHGIKKSTSQKVISLIGDGTFFHAGIPALINTVFNKSNPLIIILDNMTTAMTGHQPNPGMGKTGAGEVAEEIKIEEIVKACGVKNIKVLDPIDIKDLENSIKEFLAKDEASVIICRRICALLAGKQK